MALERYIKVSISNTSQDPVRVALLPSYLAEKKYVLEDGKIKQVASAEALQKAGYAVDFVAIQDGKQELGELSVEISSPIGYSSFANFLAYIKNNPTLLKKLTIISDTAVAPDLPDDPNITTYNYSAVVQGGGGAISPGSGYIAEGLTQEFTLTPKTGYIIDKLLDNNFDKTDTIMANKYILENVKEEHELVATFKKKEYQLTITNTEGGKTDPTGTLTVEHGKDLDITIMPDEGYKLKGITSNGQEIDPSKIVNDTFNTAEIYGDSTLNFIFEKIEYQVISRLDGEWGQTRIIPIEKTVQHGDDLDILIMTDQKYELVDFTINGHPSISKVIGGSLSLKKITRATTIVFLFKKKTNKFTAVVQGGNGTITPVEGDIEYGGKQEFIITPNSGYAVDKLLDNNIDKTDKIITD